MLPVSIAAYTLSSAIGTGRAATLSALREQRSGLTPNDFLPSLIDTYIGRVAEIEDVSISDRLSKYDCRNNRLALLGLEQDNFLEIIEGYRKRYGAKRIAVIVGTSTSGVLSTELAYENVANDGGLKKDYCFAGTHNMFSLAAFLCDLLSLGGPALVISTACSSSAKVFSTAARYLRAELCDAVLVGGVDSLCLTTLYGFNALQLVSRNVCCPFDAQREGISIGEAAGFALLERANSQNISELRLLGYGESTDAYHMSAPHPEGTGAILAMTSALNCAGLEYSEVDYVNLHGTATSANDLVEDAAVYNVFGGNTPCSSSKGWTGHTLGAAGITDAIISALCIENKLLPGTLNMKTVDPTMKSNILKENSEQAVNRVMSNSFGFGGTNCSLVLGHENV